MERNDESSDSDSDGSLYNPRATYSSEEEEDVPLEKTGRKTEVPVVQKEVVKAKKPRSQKQIDAFEKARQTRLSNLEQKRRNGMEKKQTTVKKEKVVEPVRTIESDDSESSEEEEVVVVKTSRARKSAKPPPPRQAASKSVSKRKKKTKYVYESPSESDDSESSESSDDSDHKQYKRPPSRNMRHPRIETTEIKFV